MVNSTAPFIFEHSSIGLKQFGKGRAAAAVNYQTNTRKCEKIVTVNLPNCNRYALMEAVQRYEDALPRKDSRVAEVFTVGFDRALSAEHRELVTRRFLWKMTGYGRARAWACLHHNDEGNPHMHAGYLDRDIESGKSVQMMTGSPKARLAKGMDRTGTDFARRMWEEANNSVYQEFGYERVMDRRSKDKQREVANENFVDDVDVVLNVPPPYAPTHQLEESPAPAHEQELVQEDDMGSANRVYDAHMQAKKEAVEEELEGKGRIVAGEPAQTTAERVKGAYQLGKRLEEMNRQRKALTVAQDWREKAETEKSLREVSADQLHTANQSFEQAHTNAYGDLRGFQLPGWLPGRFGGWRSPGRREAEQAQAVLNEKRRQQDELSKRAERYDKLATEKEQESAQDAAAVPGYADMTPEQRRETLRDMERFEEQVRDGKEEMLEETSAEEIWTAWRAIPEKDRPEEAQAFIEAAESKGFDDLAQAIRYDLVRALEEGQEVE